MKIIGLTGPTGSGKSTVISVINEYGFPSIDADIISRQVVEKGTAGLVNLVEVFGRDILDKNGSLNRRALGSVAFANTKNTQLLNDTIFPYILTELEKQFSVLEKQGNSLVFLDAPTLFESGFDKRCHQIVVVISEQEIRKERLLIREPDLLEEQVEQRMNAQPEDGFYILKADFVIKNNGNIKALVAETKAVLSKIERGINEAKTQ